MKLDKAAKKVAEGSSETLVYMDFLAAHRVRIRTNNVPERLNRKIRKNELQAFMTEQTLNRPGFDI